VYGRWIRLPKETRPALYLYGVSLGALNSDLSFDVHDIIAEPFDGALWTRPPRQMLAKALESAGVSVMSRNFDGSAHEFFGMGAVVPDAKEAVAFAAGDRRRDQRLGLGVSVEHVA
jgi:hypothetical protein